MCSASCGRPTCRGQSVAPAQAKICAADIGAMIHTRFFVTECTVQLRNTFGLRLDDGKLVLAGLWTLQDIDQIQQKIRVSLSETA